MTSHGTILIGVGSVADWDAKQLIHSTSKGSFVGTDSKRLTPNLSRAA
jgi:hypothetical protein